MLIVSCLVPAICCRWSKGWCLHTLQVILKHLSDDDSGAPRRPSVSWAAAAANDAIYDGDDDAPFGTGNEGGRGGEGHADSGAILVSAGGSVQLAKCQLVNERSLLFSEPLDAMAGDEVMPPLPPEGQGASGCLAVGMGSEASMADCTLTGWDGPCVVASLGGCVRMTKTNVDVSGLTLTMDKPGIRYILLHAVHSVHSTACSAFSACSTFYGMQSMF